MQTIFHNCCGLDVHKKTVVACILKTGNLSQEDSKENVVKEIREFQTFPDDLKALKKWLESENCQHVAMESTSVYWIPIYETLEDSFEGNMEILLVNARHMHNVPGKKTDIKDAEWIASLLRSGLLRGSFIPPKEIRELRDLTRYRKNVVQDIAVQKNRIEKTLQMAGIKLSTILTDPHGVSARNLINVFVRKGYITSRDVDTETVRITSEKKEAIKRICSLRLTTHQQHFLEMQVNHLDELNAHLETIECSLAELLARFEEAIKIIDTIPGIAETAATAIIAEIGVDMDKFTSANHLCSWAGLTPGNNESAGKKKVHALLTATHTLKHC